jgi:Xaa-Pro aminopeptidase
MAIIPASEYQQRRQQLVNQLQPNSITIIPGATEIMRNGIDNHFQFRQNSDFYYVTGFDEPDAIAVLLKDASSTSYLLFNRPRDPVMEIWNGRRAGQEGAVKHFGADQAFDIHEFEQKLPELLQGREVLYFAFGRQMHWDRIINKYINRLREKLRSGVSVPHTIINPETYLHEMRLHKSATEIATMRKANDISIEAHIKAIQHCKPGKYEYELQAVMTETFLRHGSHSYAYYPIVGTGENSCILHYQENKHQINDGDIVLIDAGCEYENYSSDITRSFPANGKFTAEQRAIYDIVLNAQVETLKIVKPGTVYPLMQETVAKIITEGLISLGLLKGNLSDLIAKQAYTTFYMHRSGHWLGLDTHDVGNYKPNNDWRKLASGMVLTVEPGIYISPNTPNVDKKWWGIGIRIEDDVLVTEKGCESFTQALPKTINDIEALMRG